MATEYTKKDAEQDSAIRALSVKVDALAATIKKHEDLEASILAKLAASNELIAEDIRTLGKHIIEVKTFAELKRGVTPLSTQIDLHANKK